MYFLKILLNSEHIDPKDFKMWKHGQNISSTTYYLLYFFSFLFFFAHSNELGKKGILCALKIFPQCLHSSYTIHSQLLTLFEVFPYEVCFHEVNL